MRTFDFRPKTQKKITVCQGCTERTLGCHSTCEKYKEQRAEFDRMKEAKHKDDGYFEYMSDKTKSIGRRQHV